MLSRTNAQRSVLEARHYALCPEYPECLREAGHGASVLPAEPRGVAKDLSRAARPCGVLKSGVLNPEGLRPCGTATAVLL